MVRTPRMKKASFFQAVKGLTVPAIVCVCAAVAPALARAEISVTASVQPGSTTLGEPVQLSITVNGSQRVNDVPAVSVEGAQTQHIGASTQISVVNGNFSSSITHRYLITPQKRGDLLIPPIAVNVEGRRLETEAVKVRVLDPGQGAQGEPAQPGPLVELEIPKRSVYVGESFPAEARVLVPSGLRWRLNKMPDFTADAFTKLPFQQPQTTQFVKDGQTYEVCSFRTLMTAVKSGKVPIGPLSFIIQVSTPQKRNNNATNPFGGLFNGFPFDVQTAPMQERNVILPEHTLEVKELPTEGKPSSFRGAIGRFRFSASVNQRTVKAGEPLSITLQVEGEGNFDRIEAPPMIDTDGWRAYPPEISFVKSDESGLRGVKTFQIAVVPEKRHLETPIFEFASFDPESAQYQTVKNPPSPLVVVGIKDPEPPKPAAPEVAPKPETKAAAKADSESVLQETLLAVPSEATFWSSQRIFWGLQALIAMALGGAAAAVAIRRTRARSGPARELQRRLIALEKDLHSETKRGTFMRLGTRIVQLRTAARTGQPEEAVEADAAIHAFIPQPDNGSSSRSESEREQSLAHQLAWLFETDAAQRFAGNATHDSLQPEERARVLALLAKIR